MSSDRSNKQAERDLRAATRGTSFAVSSMQGKNKVESMHLVTLKSGSTFFRRGAAPAEALKKMNVKRKHEDKDASPPPSTPKKAVKMMDDDDGGGTNVSRGTPRTAHNVDGEGLGLAMEASRRECAREEQKKRLRK